MAAAVAMTMSLYSSRSRSDATFSSLVTTTMTLTKCAHRRRRHPLTRSQTSARPAASFFGLSYRRRQDSTESLREADRLGIDFHKGRGDGRGGTSKPLRAGRLRWTARRTLALGWRADRRSTRDARDPRPVLRDFRLDVREFDRDSVAHQHGGARFGAADRHDRVLDVTVRRLAAARRSLPFPSPSSPSPAPAASGVPVLEASSSASQSSSLRDTRPTGLLRWPVDAAAAPTRVARARREADAVFGAATPWAASLAVTRAEWFSERPPAVVGSSVCGRHRPRRSTLGGALAARHTPST